MTKEELEKEVEKCVHTILFWLKLPINKESVKEGGYYILELLEPREKRIAELEITNKRISDECHRLVDTLEKKQNENAELIGKVAFTENALNNAKAQIEKMKNCKNCKNEKIEGACGHFTQVGCCKNWELAK